MDKVVINQLTVEVTRRCNMSCPHCLRGDAENVDILNWDVDNVLDQTESVGLLTVTGGEPLLNLPALQHLANGIARRGIPLMRFQVITNGLIYDESFIVILKRFAEIVHLTQQHGYDHSEREPWRVQVGVSLDRYHAEPEKCKKNYIQYKNALRGYAEVLRVSHGNAPRNEGRAKTLPNTIDFDKIISTYMLQQIEVLSADHKPMCRFFDSYHLSRPDQKIICCGLYLSADGQVLPGVGCDMDFNHRGIAICNSWEPLWDSILKYNSEEGRMHCTECDDYRIKIGFLQSREQANKERALFTSKEAQDEPSSEPMYIGDIKRHRKNLAIWGVPDTYEEFEKLALAKDYLQPAKEGCA